MSAPVQRGKIARINNISPGRWIAPSTAAWMIDVNTCTLVRWSKEGLITSVQPGESNRRRYLAEEIEIVAKLCDGQRAKTPILREYVASNVGNLEDNDA